MAPPKVLTIYNPFHLGDQIYNMFLFQKLGDYFIENDITIHYYCNSEHFYQVSEFISTPDNVKLLPYNKTVDSMENAICLHIGDQRWAKHLFNRPNFYFDDFYIVFWNQFLQLVNIPREITSFDYTDPDLLDRYRRFPPEFQELDILVINSTPLSGQYFIHEIQWNYVIKRLSQMYKVATTKKVENQIPCTMDKKYTVKDIGAISTKAKVIIAVNTGPLSGCINTYTLENVRKIYFFDGGNDFHHPKFQKIDQITDISKVMLDQLI